MPNHPAANQLIRDWNRLPARLLDVKIKKLESGETFRFGGVCSAAFVLASRGKGHLTLGGSVHDFNGACAIHVSRCSEIALTAERNTELHICVYTFPALASDCTEEHPDDCADLIFVPYDILGLKHSFDLLAEQWIRLGALGQLRLTSLLYEWVHGLFEQQQSSRNEAAADQRILRALRHMTGYLSHTVTLTEIAEAAGCGTRRLAQLFRERFEQSPFQVLTGIRMERAKQDLQSTSATLQQIAEQVGYANAYSFSRQFKQSFGCSPESYRRSDVWTQKTDESRISDSPARIRLLSDLKMAENRDDDNRKNRIRHEARTHNVSPILTAPAVAIPGSTRTVNTVMGAIEIPDRPRRIVTDWSIGHLLALGEQPIGAPSTLLHNGGLLDDFWKTAPSYIGTHNEISHERILELEPDLILTWNPQAYASYARIAPTLVFEADRCDGAEHEMRMLGLLIGRKKEAEAWIRDSRLRTQRLRTRLAERFAKPATFTLADPYWCSTHVTLIGNAAHRGGRAVYDRLNLPFPPSFKRMLTGGGEDSVRVSGFEPEAHLGDWVLVMNYDASYGLASAPDWNHEEIARRHRIVDLPWNRYFLSDPLSSLLQAEELTQMLDRPFSPF